MGAERELSIKLGAVNMSLLFRIYPFFSLLFVLLLLILRGDKVRREEASETVGDDWLTGEFLPELVTVLLLLVVVVLVLFPVEPMVVDVLISDAWDGGEGGASSSMAFSRESLNANKRLYVSILVAKRVGRRPFSFKLLLSVLSVLECCVVFDDEASS